MNRIFLLMGTVALVTCADGERRATAESARGDVTFPADTGMAGMDHSKMPGMGGSAAGDMAGMDHSKMPGMADSAAGGVAGMDHANMPAMSRPSAGQSAMEGMDHANMPAMSRPSAGQAPMAGMDHANMPGMRRTPARGAPAQIDHANMPGMTMPATPRMASVSAADMKLDSLVNALLNDPVVRQRIQSDSSLKRRWDEAARQTILLDGPDSGTKTPPTK